jgi:hypothetical protein
MLAVAGRAATAAPLRVGGKRGEGAEASVSPAYFTAKSPLPGRRRGRVTLSRRGGMGPSGHCWSGPSSATASAGEFLPGQPGCDPQPAQSCAHLAREFGASLRAAAFVRIILLSIMRVRRESDG